VPEFEQLSEHGKLQVLFDMTPSTLTRGAVGGHQVRLQTLRGYRTGRDGRGSDVAAGHGGILRAVHDSGNPILDHSPAERGTKVLVRAEISNWKGATRMNAQKLIDTARAMVADDKGLLRWTKVSNL